MTRRFFARKLTGLAAAVGLGGVVLAKPSVSAAPHGWRIVIKLFETSYHMCPEGCWRIQFDMINPQGDSDTLHVWARKPFLPHGLPWPKEFAQSPLEVSITGIDEPPYFDSETVCLCYRVKHEDGRVEDRHAWVDRCNANRELDLS